MAYENIILERKGRVCLIRFNRPQALNALNRAMTGELARAIGELESDPDVGAIVLTGNEKAFAAGADIQELRQLSMAEAYTDDFIGQDWEKVASCRIPIIAAVAGYALGGGLEIAMMCDFIIAADNAKFGQPEVGIGTITGAGGSQRLTRLVGKAKAMDMILTGRFMKADEAEASGLVSRVVSADDLLDESLKAAGTIAALSRPVTMMAKEAVNRAYETSLEEGIRFERRLFNATFALEDQSEGMAAFAEKRKPDFKNK
jgi:enoyl-CoA hydratase